MTEAIVRASIKTILESVSDIGIVYDLEPFADTWDIFIDRFKTTISGVPMVRGWTISCQAIPAQGLVSTGLRETGNQFVYEYHIRGYQSFDFETETEKVFLLIVLDLMDALNTGIVTGSVINADLAQLPSYIPSVFGGVLCHTAEIVQIVRDQI